jgi:hypothetical protein
MKTRSTRISWILGIAMSTTCVQAQTWQRILFPVYFDTYCIAGDPMQRSTLVVWGSPRFEVRETSTYLSKDGGVQWTRVDTSLLNTGAAGRQAIRGLWMADTCIVRMAAWLEGSKTTIYDWEVSFASGPFKILRSTSTSLWQFWQYTPIRYVRGELFQMDHGTRYPGDSCLITVNRRMSSTGKWESIPNAGTGTFAIYKTVLPVFDAFTVTNESPMRFVLPTNHGVMMRNADSSMWHIMQTAGFLDTASIRTFVVNPMDPRVMYMTADSGDATRILMRSMDAGEHWTRLNSIGSIKQAVNPAARSLLAIANDSLLSVSTNHGNTWALTCPVPTTREGGVVFLHADVVGKQVDIYLRKWNDVYVLKDVVPGYDPTAVHTPPAAADIALDVYPQPLQHNGSGFLHVACAQSRRLRLDLVDLLGRTVATLFDGEVHGERTIAWNAPAAPGMYFIHVQGGIRVATHRILIQ